MKKVLGLHFPSSGQLTKGCSRVAWSGLICLVAVALLWACDAGPQPTPRPAATLTPEPTTVPTPQPAATPSLEPTTVPTPEPTTAAVPEPTTAATTEPTTTPASQPTSTPESLTSAQIFDKVSPAIAFIETASSTGSGVLIEGGYVVTNAHVVWPYDTARVAFPNGSEFNRVAVKGWDLLADLAVLGPIDAPAGVLALVDGESLPIGTDLFLIGYPGETEPFPQPTMVRGLLSRIREWESIGVTYLQTDAPLIGGQSGGALVSDRGEVIGVSGFRFTEAHFGIVASSADVLPRVTGIITDEDPSGLGNRRVPLEGGEFRHEVALGNFWSQLAYVVNEPLGAVIDFEFTGDNDGGLTLYDSLGTELLFIDSEYTGAEIGSVAVEYEEPHFLIALQLSESTGDFTLKSNRRLIPIHDPDDGGQLGVGQSVLGNIDFPGDVDHFFVDLKKGETIEIVAQSTLTDTFLTVDYVGAMDEQIIVDDDSGGGLFGLDSTIVYRAPHTGSYFVVVTDSNFYAPGGYVIRVDAAGRGAVPTTTTRASLFGDSDVASTLSASSDFGLAELRSAFLWLPASFEEADPSYLELAIEDMGLEDYFSDSVIFINAEPFEMIMAASGQVGELAAKALDLEMSSTALDDLAKGFLSGVNADQESVEIHESGLLDSSTVGVSSFGAYVDFTIEDIRLRMEFIMFRRGDLAGVVYSYSPPGTQPIVPIEKAATMLDEKMSDVILAR